MKKILVVDDSAVARKIVVRCLKIGGHSESGFPKTGRGDWAGGAEYPLAVYETDDEERIALA